MNCRVCRSPDGSVVLALGDQPAADHFPDAADRRVDATHELSMWLCARCGLAQLQHDDTASDEPRGVEPRALTEQARTAMGAVAAGGWLPTRGTVGEFGSPHGGSWLEHAERLGLQQVSGEGPVDVLIDSFGVMHEADQRAAFARRAARLAPGGVLLLQFQTLSGILAEGQWTALRHGHFGYYSLTALAAALEAAGLRALHAWQFSLYGGTTLLAVRAAAEGARPDRSIQEQLDAERHAAVTSPAALRTLQDAFTAQLHGLRSALTARADAGRTVYGYGAASRAVALLAAAGLGRADLAAIGDASPAKQGRRMPGTDIPIVTPEALVAADPDEVVLFLPDLLAEVRAAHPAVADRLRTLPDFIDPMAGDAGGRHRNYPRQGGSS